MKNKKLLSLLLIVVLCASCTVFTACDGTSTILREYDTGNFQAVSESAFDDTFNTITDVSLLDFLLQGRQIDVEAKVSLSALNANINATGYTASNNGKLIASANGSATMLVELGTIDAYYKDGWAYEDATIAGEEDKVKQSLSMDTINNYLAPYTFAQLQALYNGDYHPQNCSYFVDDTTVAGQKTLKLSTTNLTIYGQVKIVDLSLFLVLKDNAVQALCLSVKLEVNLTDESTSAITTCTVNATVGVKSWEGTILFPSDFSDYEEGTLDFSSITTVK